MPARTVCTAHARRAAPAWTEISPAPTARGRILRRPPAVPGRAALCAGPRPAQRTAARRPCLAGTLLRFCTVAASACLLAASLRLMAAGGGWAAAARREAFQPPSPVGSAPAALPLAVTPVLQNPELPNGCEAASLAALLQYQGFSVSAAELASSWLPCEAFTYAGAGRFGPDPEAAYAGDPFSAKNGWYCFEGPVVAAANGYLAAQGSPLSARALTGAEPDQLLAQVQAGRPVAVWFTQDYEPPRYSSHFCWTLPGGGSYRPYANLHCVVLTGMTDNTCTLADPLEGTVQVDRARFSQIYAAMGSRAVVLL